MTVGDRNTCGRRTTRRLFCWGDNSWGQLPVVGVLYGSFLDSPAQVEDSLTNWAGIGVGLGTCGLRTNGRLFCSANPGLIEPTGGHTDWEAITVGWGYQCALRGSGRLYCYGTNGDGQLGDGTIITRFDPVEVVA